MSDCENMNKPIQETDPGDFALRRQVPLIKRFGLTHLAYATALFASGMAFLGGQGMLVASFILLVWIFVFSKDQLSPGCVAFLIVGTLFLCLICLPVFFLVSTPAQKKMRDCESNFTDLSRSIIQYTYQNGHVPGIPPEDPIGPSTKPKHSWRVYLLPTLGLNELYAQYDFNEAWDGPNNSKLLDQMPDVYRCQSHASTRNTHVFMVKGEKAWLQHRKQLWQGNKILLIEDINRNVPWTKPEDVTMDEALEILARNPQDDCPHTYEDSFSKVYTGRSVGTSEASYYYSLPAGIRKERLLPYLDDSTNDTPLWELLWDFDKPSEFKISGLISVLSLFVLSLAPIFFVGRKDLSETTVPEKS